MFQELKEADEMERLMQESFTKRSYTNYYSAFSGATQFLNSDGVTSRI